MRPELDEALCRDFPNLYRDRHGDKTKTNMCWGFTGIGDGWEPLIRELSAGLEKLILELPEEQRKDCCASQCKQKFGGLRFSMTKYNPQIIDLIRVAENKSITTCENCGKEGSIINENNWLNCICNVCRLLK